MYCTSINNRLGAHWIPLSPALLLFRGVDYFGPVKPCTFAIKPFNQVRMTFIPDTTCPVPRG